MLIQIIIGRFPPHILEKKNWVCYIFLFGWFQTSPKSGLKVIEKVARHFPEGKGDASRIADWERQLKTWGGMSLNALTGEERRKEEHRRMVGEKAARDATTKAVNSGGEFTIEAMVGPKSELSVSENALMIAVSPADLLTIVANLMNAASSSPQDLQSAIASLRAHFL